MNDVNQGGYIFYAGGSLAGADYCRQCRRRPAILLLQLWQGCQGCVKISAQRLPRVVQFNACVANVGDSLRRLCSLQHRIYNLLARASDSAVRPITRVPQMIVLYSEKVKAGEMLAVVTRPDVSAVSVSVATHAQHNALIKATMHSEFTSDVIQSFQSGFY